MVFPGLALFLTVMAVNLVGDWLSVFLDPRHRSRK
jgi:ABC-type dipeptide/oligopeptide/nickel transport system permease subunit